MHEEDASEPSFRGVAVERLLFSTACAEWLKNMAMLLNETSFYLVVWSNIGRRGSAFYVAAYFSQSQLIQRVEFA
jgi:hypothetical protein